MSPITVTLTSSSMISHVPLAGLGYALRRAQVLAPLLELDLPIKAIDHTPTEKLATGLVLILAGGRALYQTNWLLRPNTRLACAWGQAEFAGQSTISDTFDALSPESLQLWHVAHRAGPPPHSGTAGIWRAQQRSLTKGRFAPFPSLCRRKNAGLFTAIVPV